MDVHLDVTPPADTADLDVVDRVHSLVRRGLTSGAPTAVHLVGGPGLGKTHLVDLVTRRWIEGGGTAIRVDADRHERDVPHAFLHRWCLQAAGSGEGLGDDTAALVALLESADPSPLEVARRVAALWTSLAEDRRLLLAVDDVDLIDPDSVRAIGRGLGRVAGTQIGMVTTATDWAGALPQRPSAAAEVIQLQPLTLDASRAVVRAAFPAAAAESGIEDAVTAAGGVPGDLLALVASLDRSGIVGESRLDPVLPRDSPGRSAYARRKDACSEDAQQVLAVVAAESPIDLLALHRCVGALGLEPDCVDEALRTGLLTLADGSVRFLAPAVRATVRAETQPHHLRDAHRVLAEWLDPQTATLRRLWHQEKALPTPLPGLPERVDAIAKQARVDHRHAVATEAFEWSAELHSSPERSAARLLAAAHEAWRGGDPVRATRLTRRAPLVRSDALRRERTSLAAIMELRCGDPLVARHHLLQVAGSIREDSPDEAIDLLQIAGEAACISGDGAGLAKVAGEMASLLSAGSPADIRILVDHEVGLSRAFEARHDLALEPLQRTVAAAGEASHPRLLVLGSEAAFALGDGEAAQELAQHAIDLASSSDRETWIPWAMLFRSMSALLLDQHLVARASSEEGEHLARSLGQRNIAVDHATIRSLATALRGEPGAQQILDSVTSEINSRGLGRARTLATWVRGYLALTDDRPHDALGHLQTMDASPHQSHPAFVVMAVPHLVEAAMRCDEPEIAKDFLWRYDAWAELGGGPARRALSHRCHALIAEDVVRADRQFDAAVALHRSAGTSFELAHTLLAYGRRVRRERGPRAARPYLRQALSLFENQSAESWAVRARQELRAAGITTQDAPVAAIEGLTPQQLRIAAYVATGSTNKEIAEHLSVSPRTVDHHLRNIFDRLQIRSRVELAQLVSTSAAEPSPGRS